jgi:pimeloyl-ACP methyl ester carboxylesterase
MDRYARPQQLVRVNRRRRLNLLVTGEGGPTVVLAAGFLGGTLDWGYVQHRLSRSRRVVSFDTAGLGFSDPGPPPRTSSAIVRDLRAALANAGIGPPYILAGHSAGGLRMHLFAALHPEEVAGLVLVDSVQPDWRQRLEPVGSPGIGLEQTMLRRLLALAVAGNLNPQSPEYIERIGLPRAGLSPAVNQALHEMWIRPSYLRTALSESQNLRAVSEREVAAYGWTLGDLPLVVLTAGQAAQMPFLGGPAGARVWQAMHEELAALSSRGVQRIIDSGHNIPVERPDAVVAAVEEVAAKV